MCTHEDYLPNAYNFVLGVKKEEEKLGVENFRVDDEKQNGDYAAI